MVTPPRIRFHDGTVEALKWLALLLMTGDHINKYLLRPMVDELLWAGRLAMPIFMVVMAYNLSRPRTGNRGIYQRTCTRLAIFGTIASVPFIGLGHLLFNYLPLNILFTLLFTVLTIFFIERAQHSQDDNLKWATNWMLAIGVYLVGGALGEFWWPALTLGTAAWFYFRRPGWIALIVLLASWVSLIFINQSHWALAAIPVLLIASKINIPMPRWRWAFYVYYPLHFYLIWFIYLANGGPFIIGS